jgi:CheY-like chemotaxis protein
MDYKPKTVLIADDSETFMMYISIVLRRMGFDVIPAEDGIEALKLLGIFSPDVVLLDIDMSKMNGIETPKAIRENSNLAHLPVVIISVESGGGTYRECRQAGCSGYLTKPMKIAELNDILQAHIVYERDRRRKHLRTSFEGKSLRLEKYIEELPTEDIK